MTVYVDSASIPARVGGRPMRRWSHLTADTPAELLAFAAKIGLQRSWFQGTCKSAPNCPRVDGVCRHYHFDVTTAVRAKAVRAGAREITMHQLSDLLQARREGWGR